MEDSFKPFGPEWSREMQKLNKSELIIMLRKALQDPKPVHNSMDAFDALFKSHAEFSNRTFGDVRGPLGPINHLKKEVEELLNAPEDRSEYADCFLLLLDAFRRSGGGNHRDLIHAAFMKLEINEQRQWGMADENGVVEHIKKDIEASRCPECLEAADQDELDTFSGLCEDCCYSGSTN